MTRLPTPTSLRSGRLVQLLAYLPRVGRWAVVPAAAGVAAVLLGLAALGDTWNAGSAMSDLRLVAVVLAGATTFALDDPAMDTLATSPTTLRWRRTASLVLVVALLGILWSALLWLTALLLPGGVAAACLAVVRRPLTGELVTLVVVAVALAVLAARRLGGLAGGAAAAPGMVLVFVALGGPLGALPGSPLDHDWTVGHRRLLLGALVAAALVLWGVRDGWQRRAAPRWRPVVATALVLGVLAAPLLQQRPAGTPERLDAALADLAAAQGIEGLVVVVEGPDLAWARAVAADGSLVPLSDAARTTRAELGGLSIGEVGTTIELAGGVLNGASSPAEVAAWARGLRGDGELGERVAAAPAPAGAAWRPVDPRIPHRDPTALTEVRVVAASGTVVTVLTAGAVLPPCGMAVADALVLALAR